MRTKTSRHILIAVAAVLLLAVGAAVLWCGGGMPARAQGQTLDGFTSPGASVFVATDGSGEKQMRFEVRLTAGAAEGLTGSPEEETLDSGMIVLPYDLYTANDVTELTLDTPGIRTADLTRYWEATDGGYTSYAYIPADIVPAGQENRVLVARGYIRDGDTVYYTDEVKASMAYVAWQSLSDLSEYEEELKAYMGPYTLTYGDDATVCFTGYYGEPLAEIPMTAGGYNVLAWYWDEARTAEIAETDYITGSMRIYPKMETYSVSGTISCADPAFDGAYTNVTVYVDGAETQTEVGPDGRYTLSLEAGPHEITFLAGVYGASKEISVNGVTELDASLADWTWKIGDYGTFASVGGVYDADDALDGSLTVSTGGEHYSIVMPNTATAAAAEYVVTTSGLSFGSDVSDGNKDNHYFGFGLSDGTSMLSFTVSRWHFLGVNMATLRGTGNRTVYNIGKAVSEAGSGNRTYKLVRTADAMTLYVNDALVLTLTAGGITAGNGVSFMWDDGNGVTSAAQYAGYFGADTELAFGLATTQVAPDATVTYKYTMTELVEVTGTIACEDASLDLSATEVQVDGLKTMATVSADGQFSVSVVPGTKHTLTFTNGVYGAEVVLPVGTYTAEAELVDRTWKIGDYGTFASVGDVYNADDVLDGSFTVTTDSAHYAIAMPNTATTEAMEYTITMSEATGTSDDQYFGFGLTNGTYMLSFTFSRWSFVRINLNTSAGDGEQRVWNVSSSTGVGFGQGARTYRLIRTADEIRLYINDVMIFTLTADSITAGTGVTITDWATTDIPSLAIYDAFFGTDVELALGFTTTGTTTAGASRTYTVSMEPYTETAEETEQ